MKLEWQALWGAMDAQPEAWIDTTEAMYWEMLEVLPPRAMHGDAVDQYCIARGIV